jgi:hypothetical protein
VDDPKVYLILDRISPRLRALVSAVLMFAGFVFQLSTKNILAGMPFIVFCVLLNVIKSIAIKRVTPEKLVWEEVTRQKIEEVAEHCRKIKKFRSGNLGCFFGMIIAVVFFGVFLSPIIQDISLPFSIVATVVNAFVLFTGLILSGRKSIWMPRALDIKIQIVNGIMESPLIRCDPGLSAIPYLEIGQTGQGSFPNDARILIKLRDAPDEFIGLQGQISINTVKSRDYPYFYVVLLAHPGFGLFEKFKSLKVVLDDVTIEHKKTAEVDVIVIRQTTTKTSGFHTDQRAQDHILANSIKAAKTLI